MTPDDMANYHEHMEEWNRKNALDHAGSVLAERFEALAEHHRESARYWRNLEGE